MTKSPAKTKSEEPKEPSSSDVLASFMEEHKGEHYNDVVPVNRVISTGSLKLDSFVKIRSGSIVRLLGRGSELGKSSEAFVLATNYMKAMPKSKTLYIKAEARLSTEMKQRSGLTFVTEASAWEYGTVFELCMNAFESVATLCETLVKDMYRKGEHICVVADSMDGFILKKDLEVKGIDGNTMVAGVPKLTKLLFRRLALPITHYDVLMIILSQYSTDIKIDPYAPAAPRQGTASGGSALMHQVDYALQYAQRYAGDNILEDDAAKPDPVKNKIIGVWATVEVLKSASDTSGTKIKIPIKKGRVGSAIWVEKEVGDMLLAYDLVKKGGSWLTFDTAFIKEAKEAGVTIKEKVQGLNGLYDYIENDRPVFEWLYSRFRKMLGQDEA